MPTASGQPSFDDLVAFFTTDPPPNPMQLSRSYPTFIAGIVDLRDRLEALEAGYLETAHRCSLLEDRAGKTETTVTSLEATRTVTNERLDKIEKQPAADAERLDKLETRVRTVEGAVGHANLPDDGRTRAPADAKKEPEPTKTAGSTAAGIFGAESKPSTQQQPSHQPA